MRATLDRICDSKVLEEMYLTDQFSSLLVQTCRDSESLQIPAGYLSAISSCLRSRAHAAREVARGLRPQQPLRESPRGRASSPFQHTRPFYAKVVDDQSSIHTP